MEFFVGNLMARARPLLKSGDKITGHKHHEPHVTVCLSGSLLVHRDDGVTVMLTAHGPVQARFVNVEAERMHELVALEDGTQYACLFVRKPGQDLISDPAYGER